MKKKLIIGALSLFLGLSLASCDKKEEPKVESEKYSIEVFDIDGEKLLEREIIKSSNSLLEDLKTTTTVEGYDSQYGYSLTSINGSIKDPNYYLAIYENGEYAQTGIDGLKIDNGDKFKFQVECFNTKASGYGTMDETDILVDKIIYSYAKNQMKEYLAKTGTYTAEAGWDNSAFGAADYWSFIFNDFMIENNYDKNVFNFKDVPANLKTNLEAFDVTKLSGAQFGKYYFAAKGLGVDLNGNFKTAYQNYLNNLPETYDVYKEYEYPFTLGISKKLNVTSANFNSLVNTTYRADTSFGIDGLAWQLASLSQFVELNKNELRAFEAKDYGNAISTALALLPYAAIGENPRSEEYKKDGKDLVEILIDNYYDSANKIIKYNNEELTNANTPQIYAYLAAYKVARDSGKKVSIFA